MNSLFVESPLRFALVFIHPNVQYVQLSTLTETGHSMTIITSHKRNKASPADRDQSNILEDSAELWFSWLWRTRGMGVGQRGYEFFV